VIPYTQWEDDMTANEDTGQNLTFNQDGSVEIPVDGKPTRFVKEADLLAVKGSREKIEKDWETEKTSFQTKLAEANRLREESHAQFLQAQAANTTLAEQFKDHDTLKARAGELEQELGTHKEKLTAHEKELASRIRQNLIGSGAAEDSLKDKTLDQLRNLEEAAKIFGGHKPQPPRYDGGRPGGGSAPETPLDRAKRVLEENESKRGARWKTAA
jgi:hypothetical protein